MLRKYRHISFDLDGTLVHTVPEYPHKIISSVVSKLGGEIPGKHLINEFWFGAGRNEIIVNQFGLKIEDFWKIFDEIDTQQSRHNHTKAYNDSEPSLRKLKEMDKIISIITGAPEWIAEIEIKKLNGAPHDFYFSIGRGETEKPNPESLLNALRKLGIAPQETVYIGNSNEDALYAKNAGVDFIYIDRGEHEFEIGNNAIATIKSLEELFK